MPQPVGPGWLSSSRMRTPPAKPLAMKEVEQFLDFLFHDVASRPEPMRLNEVAGVVRYLDALATTGVPSRIVQKGATSVNRYCAEGEYDEKGRHRTRDWSAKQSADTIANALWSTLRQCGKIKLATKAKVIRLVKTHSTNYSPQTVDAVLAFVRNAEPYESDHIFQPVALISRSQAVGMAGRHLQNDLSERIAVAKSALGKVRVPRANVEIARALKRHRCPKRDKSTDWYDTDVHERAKDFTQAFRTQHHSGTKSKRVVQSLVDSWIFRFRYGKSFEPLDPLAEDIS